MMLINKCPIGWFGDFMMGQNSQQQSLFSFSLQVLLKSDLCHSSSRMNLEQWRLFAKPVSFACWSWDVKTLVFSFPLLPPFPNTVEPFINMQLMLKVPQSSDVDNYSYAIILVHTELPKCLLGSTLTNDNLNVPCHTLLCIWEAEGKH